MQCDVADSGAATISGAFISKLIGFGVSGFPTMDVYRRTVDKDSAKISGKPGGCVEFKVYSHRSYTAKVANHTPCKSQRDCKAGEVCHKETETCKPAK
jgi:hypothetical protein